MTEVEEAGEKLEDLRRINNSWIQAEDEREAVEILLDRIVKMLDQLPLD